MNVTTNSEMAKIAVNKSLLKEFSTNSGRTVYLADGTEFQIQLFNPYEYTIGAKISINGDEMSNMLVIKPGQRIWLERYLDNTSKFKFSTYEVDDSPEATFATRKNGVISIRFYKEQHRKEYPITYIKSSPSILYNGNGVVANGYGTSVSTVNTYYNSSDTLSLGASKNLSAAINCSEDSFATMDSLCASDATIKGISASVMNVMEFDNTPEASTVETGRIDRGSRSSQEFQDIDLDFCSWSFRTETINLLPLSRKPVSAEDVAKVYCHECGRKLQQKYKFCPFCGTKID